jgi:solute carrier family 10 (sodium/bile acid cotransporter), member 7
MRRYLPDNFSIALVCTVLFASQFPVSGEAAAIFSTATKIAIALLFFLHGARLSRDVVIAGLLHWRLHLVIVSVTFVIFPLVGLGLGFALKNVLSPQLVIGIIYLCTLPSTVQSSIAFTSIAGGNVPAAICAASASNIFGMFITPLLCGLLLASGNHGGGISLDTMLQIVTQLLLPFILGQLLQPLVGHWVRAHKQILMPVDRGSILMVVYGAFSEAMIEGIWHNFGISDLIMVLAVDLAVLASVLCLTVFGSRKLGFAREDEITIAFCGSKKSLASGVPMANAIFAGQPVGAIILPLMIFHQVQLLACAALAQRYATRNHQLETASAAAI